jgi:hypothetical protein
MRAKIAWITFILIQVTLIMALSFKVIDPLGVIGFAISMVLMVFNFIGGLILVLEIQDNFKNRKLKVLFKDGRKD